MPQLATITCAPNEDLKQIHHRMPILLRRDDVALWLSADEATVTLLMTPWPKGELVIAPVTDVDRTGS